jgi:5S rRNA maturation endonuclease (ribonuclease M5)
MRGENREFGEFEEFLQTFVRDLNNLSEDGGIVLVEGKRDATALRKIGYTGGILVISSFSSRESHRLLARARLIAILTDLDSEGRRLAARYTKLLRARGIDSSLTERRRLSAASKGTFLHVENLQRFSRPDGGLY